MSNNSIKTMAPIVFLVLAPMFCNAGNTPPKVDYQYSSDTLVKKYTDDMLKKYIVQKQQGIDKYFLRHRETYDEAMGYVDKLEKGYSDNGKFLMEMRILDGSDGLTNISGKVKINNLFIKDKIKLQEAKLGIINNTVEKFRSKIEEVDQRNGSFINARINKNCSEDMGKLGYKISFREEQLVKHSGGFDKKYIIVRDVKTGNKTVHPGDNVQLRSVLALTMRSRLSNGLKNFVVQKSICQDILSRLKQKLIPKTLESPLPKVDTFIVNTPSLSNLLLPSGNIK